MTFQHDSTLQANPTQGWALRDYGVELHYRGPRVLQFIEGVKACHLLSKVHKRTLLSTATITRSHTCRSFHLSLSVPASHLVEKGAQSWQKPNRQISVTAQL